MLVDKASSKLGKVGRRHELLNKASFDEIAAWIDEFASTVVVRK